MMSWWRKDLSRVYSILFLEVGGRDQEELREAMAEGAFMSRMRATLSALNPWRDISPQGSGPAG